MGTWAPAFSLVGNDRSELTCDSFAGRRVVLNIFPSLDAGVCATSVRKFNELAAGLENTTLVCVSQDLPFAQARLCGAEGIDNIVTASGFRTSFGEDYGVTIAAGGVAACPPRHLSEGDTPTPCRRGVAG